MEAMQHKNSAVCQGREVEDNDQFHFNADFSERLYRIKINAIQMKETVEENKKTNDQVLQDRQYQVGIACYLYCICLSLLRILVRDLQSTTGEPSLPCLQSSPEHAQRDDDLPSRFLDALL